ncbi:hypothetical protein EVA_04829, partial [gut metagenome]
APDALFERVSGTLSDLTLENLSIDTDAFQLKAGRVQLALEVSKLFSREVLIRQAVVSDLDMAVIPSDTPESDEPLGRLSLPVDLVLDDLTVERTSLRVAGLDFRLRELQGGYRWKGETMTVLSPTLTHFTLTLPAEEKPAVVTPPTETFLCRWLSSLQNEPLFTLPALAPEGPLPFDLTVEGLTLDTLGLLSAEAGADPLLTFKDLRLTAGLQGPRLQVSELSGHTSLDALSQFALTGELTMRDDWASALDAHVSTHLDAAPLGEIRLSLKGPVGGTMSLQVASAGEMKTRLNARWAPAVQGIPGEAEIALLTPRALTNTPNEAPLILSPTTVRLQGTAQRWTLSGNGALQRGRDLKAAITLSGEGRPSGMEHATLRVESPAGRADFEGFLTWKDCVRWEGKTRVSDLDLRRLAAVPLEHLQGFSSLTGFWVSPERWETVLSAFEIEGTYQDQPLKAKGAVTVKDRIRIDAPAVSVSLGQNQVDFQAKLERPHFEADLNINAPALGEIDSALNGRLQGSVLLRGDPQHPVFTADLRAEALHFGLTSLENASLRGTLKPDLHGTVGGRLVLAARSIRDERLESMKADSLRLTLDGTEHAHRLSVLLDGDPIDANLVFQGRFDRRTADWRGTLQRADLSTLTGR